jgi:hypothetical protein
MSLLTGGPSQAELLDPGASYASMGSLIDDRSDEEGGLTTASSSVVPPLNSEATGSTHSSAVFGTILVDHVC